MSLTALSEESWYAHVSLLGRVVSLEDDPDLVDIDRLARRYTGNRSAAGTRSASAPGSRSTAGTRGIFDAGEPMFPREPPP